MKIDFPTIIKAFNDLNNQARYSIFGAVVALVVLVDVFLLFIPQCASIGSVNSDIKKMSEDTIKLSVDMQRIKQLRKNLAGTRIKWEKMDNRIRPVQEVSAVLETISQIANEEDVKIDQITPQKQGQESLKVTGVDGHYYAFPIVIQARGGYHMFGHFLNKLENANLYFILKDMIIQNDVNDPRSDLYSLTIKIILVDRAGNPKI